VDDLNAVVLSIDPGYGLGVAVWDADFWGKELHMPLAAMNLYPGTKITGDAERITDLMNRFEREVLSQYDVHSACMELPEGFAGAEGRLAATSGNLVKLCMVAGAVVATVGCSIELIPVRVWKGQKPKEAINRRAFELLPELETLYKSHCLDAVAIGLYKQGWLKRGKDD
jgi:hypothetical protein